MKTIISSTSQIERDRERERERERESVRHQGDKEEEGILKTIGANGKTISSITKTDMLRSMTPTKTCLNRTIILCEIIYRLCVQVLARCEARCDDSERLCVCVLYLTQRADFLC